jgi:hypothetical protein
VGARVEISRVRVNRMYFIDLLILGESKESTTSDPTIEKVPSKAVTISTLQQL